MKNRTINTTKIALFLSITLIREVQICAVSDYNYYGISPVQFGRDHVSMTVE